MTWSDYLRSITSDNQAEIAARTDVHYSTVSRWLSDDIDPTPRTVIRVARCYGRNPIEALVAVGYLSPDEAELPISLWGDPATIPTEILLAEVARRASPCAPAV